MMSLKEGTDNRMLVLENLMREIGGDKMKNMMGEVAQTQKDVVSLWSENARMILEIESRAHVDEILQLQSGLNQCESKLKGVMVFTSEAAVAARNAELSSMKETMGKVTNETETNSRLVRACVERTDQTIIANQDTFEKVENLRADLMSQVVKIGEAQNLVRQLPLYSSSSQSSYYFTTTTITLFYHYYFTAVSTWIGARAAGSAEEVCSGARHSRIQRPRIHLAHQSKRRNARFASAVGDGRDV
jgi:hypothetical protein